MLFKIVLNIIFILFCGGFVLILCSDLFFYFLRFVYNKVVCVCFRVVDLKYYWGMRFYVGKFGWVVFVRYGD